MKYLLALVLCLFLGAARCAADEQTLPVAERCVVTLDGRPCQLSDLPEGAEAVITTENGEVVRIEATSPKE